MSLPRLHQNHRAEDLNSWSSNQVAKFADVSLRQLQWWDERRVVMPRHEGHRRIYQKPDVIEIAVISQLREKGFSLQKIRRVIRTVQKEIHRFTDLEAELLVLTDGIVVYVEDDSAGVVDILRRSKRPMILVDVGAVVKRIAA